MLGRPLTYRSFVLILWLERSQGTGGLAAWRFSLQDPHTGKRRGFANLDALVAALKEEMGDDRTKGQGAADRPAG